MFIFLMLSALLLPTHAERSYQGVSKDGRSVRMGDAQGSYIDPEFLESASKIAFADERNRIWLSDINLQTGMFVSSSGKDILIVEKRIEEHTRTLLN